MMNHEPQPKPVHALIGGSMGVSGPCTSRRLRAAYALIRAVEAAWARKAMHYDCD